MNCPTTLQKRGAEVVDRLWQSSSRSVTAAPRHKRIQRPLRPTIHLGCLSFAAEHFRITRSSLQVSRVVRESWPTSPDASNEFPFMFSLKASLNRFAGSSHTSSRKSKSFADNGHDASVSSVEFGHHYELRDRRCHRSTLNKRSFPRRIEAR